MSMSNQPIYNYKHIIKFLFIQGESNELFNKKAREREKKNIRFVSFIIFPVKVDILIF